MFAFASCIFSIVAVIFFLCLDLFKSFIQAEKLIKYGKTRNLAFFFQYMKKKKSGRDLDVLDLNS